MVTALFRWGLHLLSPIHAHSSDLLSLARFSPIYVNNWAPVSIYACTLCQGWLRRWPVHRGEVGVGGVAL